jgi:hypothetical protein
MKRTNRRLGPVAAMLALAAVAGLVAALSQPAAGLGTALPAAAGSGSAAGRVALVAVAVVAVSAFVTLQVMARSRRRPPGR